MATRLCWLGHACLLFESDGKHVLIDPFLTGNPKAARKAEDVPADYILISHGHSDHVGDAAEIAERTGATVIANYEIATWFQEKMGVRNAHGMQHGGAHQFPFGRVKLTLAFHGSAHRDPLPQEGYQIVFVPLVNEFVRGYEVFAEGFTGSVTSADSAAHRPVGLAQGPDGSLYVSDDKGGTIWRITYKGQAAKTESEDKGAMAKRR